MDDYKAISARIYTKPMKAIVQRVPQLVVLCIFKQAYDHTQLADGARERIHQRFARTRMIQNLIETRLASNWGTYRSSLMLAGRSA